MMNSTSESLVNKMKVVLATTFALYLKAHNYHWNVRGPNFMQLHEFFGDFYEEVHGSIDDIAEKIRIIGANPPGSLERFNELSLIHGELNIPDSRTMLMRLKDDNATLMNVIKAAYNLAETAEEIGLSNFLQDRYDAHAKHAWMLSSFLE